MSTWVLANDVWGFPALAMRDTLIPKGTRICQFRLFKCAEQMEFEEVDNLDGPDRGGFNSVQFDFYEGDNPVNIFASPKYNPYIRSNRN